MEDAYQSTEFHLSRSRYIKLLHIDICAERTTERRFQEGSVYKQWPDDTGKGFTVMMIPMEFSIMYTFESEALEIDYGD